jgi:hypothetical protein
MRGVTFILGATWLALTVWAGENVELLCIIALTAVAPRVARRRTRTSSVTVPRQRTHGSPVHPRGRAGSLSEGSRAVPRR